MLLMLAIYGVAAAAAPWLVGRLGIRAFVVLSVVPAAAFVGILTTGSDARDGTPYNESVTWIPGLDVDLAFRLDTLSWAMSLLVTGVGALVLFYCWRYFSDNEPGLGRFVATLTGPLRRLPLGSGRRRQQRILSSPRSPVGDVPCQLTLPPGDRRRSRHLPGGSVGERFTRGNGKRRIALRSCCWLLPTA